jgi:hypothetical protein
MAHRRVTLTVRARTHRVTRESDGHELLVVEYIGELDSLLGVGVFDLTDYDDPGEWPEA